MGRKPYHELVKERVSFLQVDPKKMLRVGRGKPSDRELGDVFKETCRRIQQEDDSAILRAFDACDLDLDNPFHWGDLMRVFCDLHFAKRKTKNRVRTQDFADRVAKDAAVIRGKYGNLTQERIAEHLMKDFPERYGKYKGVKSVRRLFSRKSGR
jgi:hypothetical protein